MNLKEKIKENEPLVMALIGALGLTALGYYLNPSKDLFLLVIVFIFYSFVLLLWFTGVEAAEERRRKKTEKK